ncbi:MAG: hypothetical protein AVO39_03135 [delta proteobacterium MLS_D]|jgi:putative nucleotidyltransferase with HDIG domain/predicted Zn finger-like uncharacterized protein|nr:MAG: hypothetical protein AVO39_03135 [delta proteobacterium MLS_D]
MIITCRTCGKVFHVTDDELRLNDAGEIACPACGTLHETGSRDRPVERTSAGSGPAPISGTALKKRILRTVDELPPMPEVARKARRLLADERSSFGDLARVIETDQAIAARVLKIANSSYYGFANRISSIQHAAAMLGMKTLNELLTFACTGSLLEGELTGYAMRSGDLWKHSLAVAACARSIAKEKKPALADDAFAAGLLHDCGKLILDQYIAERRDLFTAFLAEPETSFLEAEKELLGFDHAEIAAEICRKWQIPSPLTLAIKAHHKLASASGDNLASIVHAADAIALMSGIGSGIDGMKYEIDPVVMENLRITGNEIGLYMAEALEFVEETVDNL